MTCYHPLIRFEDLTKTTRGKDGHIYHPAKIVTQESLNDLETRQKYIGGHYKTNLIPCGNCIGCRLDYSREWANRGYLESLEYENNYFVTLTYDQDNLEIPEFVESEDGITYVNDEESPWGGTLVPLDLKNFMHDLRQIMKRKYNQDGIRFMACGEYGKENERPHYHLILFNFNIPLEDLYNVRIINKNYYYQSHIIEQAWKKGISNISVATWNTIAYTARYITKKINGKQSDELYKQKGQEKEFFRVSRMPGIGQNYYEKHKKEIYENDCIYIQNQKGVVKSKPPKYFDKMYEKEFPEEFKKIKRNREIQNDHNEKLKDMTTSLFRREQNEIDEKSKLNQSYQLRRNLEAGLK